MYILYSNVQYLLILEVFHLNQSISGIILLRPIHTGPKLDGTGFRSLSTTAISLRLRFGVSLNLPFK